MTINGTIGGKSMEEVLEGLRAPFPEAVFKEREGFSYLPGEEYKKRFESLVPPWNYDFIPSHGTTTSIRVIHEKAYISFTGVLRIRDDAGRELMQRTGSGGDSLIVVKASGNVSNYGNAEEVAVDSAFIKALRSLGIGRSQLKEQRGKGKSGGTQQKDLYRLSFLSTFTALQNGGYKSTVKVMNTEYENIDFIMFKEGVAKVESCIPISRFLEKIGIGSEMSAYGFLQTWKGKPQFVLTDISKK